jgi:hypothetical protein
MVHVRSYMQCWCCVAEITQYSHHACRQAEAKNMNVHRNAGACSTPSATQRCSH